MTTALLDFESIGSTHPRTPTPWTPPRRGPYNSAKLRSIKKRERDTLGRFYDAQGELHTVDAPEGARLAHLMHASLHDGAGLTAAGRDAATEVNRALDRLKAGITWDHSTIRAKPLEPQTRYGLPPVQSAEETSPRFLNQGQVTPAPNESLTVWWGTGHIILPGPVPQRYAPPEVDTFACERMHLVASRHQSPPKPGARRIVPVAVTKQGQHRGRQEYVWLSNGSAIEKAHLAAIIHEHGPTGQLAFTTNEQNTRAVCAWTTTEHGHWRRLAIVVTADECDVRPARATAAEIDDWLERLLASHAGSSDATGRRRAESTANAPSRIGRTRPLPRNHEHTPPTAVAADRP